MPHIFRLGKSIPNLLEMMEVARVTQTNFEQEGVDVDCRTARRWEKSNIHGHFGWVWAPQQPLGP